RVPIAKAASSPGRRTLHHACDVAEAQDMVASRGRVQPPTNGHLLVPDEGRDRDREGESRSGRERETLSRLDADRDREDPDPGGADRPRHQATVDTTRGGP